MHTRLVPQATPNFQCYMQKVGRVRVYMYLHKFNSTSRVYVPVVARRRSQCFRLHPLDLWYLLKDLVE